MTARFFFVCIYVMKARNVVIVYQVVFCLCENEIGIGPFLGIILITQ